MKSNPKSKLALVTAAAVAKRQAPKKKKFLRALAKAPSIKHACVAAGISRDAAYDWRKKDLVFAAAWSTVLDQAVDDVEARAFWLALNGPPDSNATAKLIELLLRAHRAAYRERQEVAVAGGIIFLPQKKDDGAE